MSQANSIDIESETLLDERLEAASAGTRRAAAPLAELFAGMASRHRKYSLRLMLMAGGIFLVAAAAMVLWLRGGRYASTDNAYVHAAKLMVSTDVSGIVSSVNVREGQAVKAGDILFQVDPAQFQIALNNAKANLDQTALTIESMKLDYKRMISAVAAQQAKVEYDQATYDRYEPLASKDYMSKANFDQARYTLQSDMNTLASLERQAQVQLARLMGNPELPAGQHPMYLQAKAQADEAQRQLDHTVVRAPFDGNVTQVDALQPGTYLVSQTAALTNTGAIGLVSTGDIWIDANMKETDLTYVKRGDHVDVAVDTYPGQVWSGTVESIAPASGSEFSILPAQNASGNWVKVVQRIPVRVKLNPAPGQPELRSGMSVTVDIDTGHRNSLADLL
jgi:membrane fusion protein, multidrug efflux system